MTKSFSRMQHTKAWTIKYQKMHLDDERFLSYNKLQKTLPASSFLLIVVALISISFLSLRILDALTVAVGDYYDAESW